MIPFFRYLKKTLLIHIITGLLCGLSISFFIISTNYRKTAKIVLQTIKNNLVTASQIREEDEVLKNKIGLLKGYLPPEYARKEPELLVLERLDRIKRDFPSYRVTVTDFKSQGNSLSIGFTAQGTIENYGNFVHRLKELEGPQIPWLSIDKLTIAITEQDNTVQFSGTIKTLRLDKSLATVMAQEER